MATRLYLNSTATPSVSPGYASWGDTGGAVRRTMAPVRQNSALTDFTRAEAVNTNNYNVLLAQFVSAPLASGGTLSGTIDGVALVSESSQSLNAYSQMVVKVVSGDGATVRGTALTFLTTGGTEWRAGTQGLPQQRHLTLTQNRTLSNVVYSAGDRIVVEVGFSARNTSTTSYSGTVRLGDPTGASEMTSTESGTTDLVPWVQFSQDLVFQASSQQVLPNPVQEQLQLHSPTVTYVPPDTLLLSLRLWQNGGIIAEREVRESRLQSDPTDLSFPLSEVERALLADVDTYPLEFEIVGHNPSVHVDSVGVDVADLRSQAATVLSPAPLLVVLSPSAPTVTPVPNGTVYVTEFGQSIPATTGWDNGIGAYVFPVPLNIPNGISRLVVRIGGETGTSAGVPGLLWKGTPLVFREGTSDSNDRNVQLWDLVNPEAGVGTLDLHNGNAIPFIVNVIGLFGDDGTDPVVDDSAGVTYGFNSTSEVATQPGDLLLSAAKHRVGALSVSSPLTIEQTQDFSANGQFAVARGYAGAGTSTTVVWTSGDGESLHASLTARYRALAVAPVSVTVTPAPVTLAVQLRSLTSAGAIGITDVGDFTVGGGDWGYNFDISQFEVTRALILPAGTTRLVVRAGIWSGSSLGFSDILWNGVPFTKRAVSSDGNIRAVEYWDLRDPASGAGTLMFRRAVADSFFYTITALKGDRNEDPTVDINGVYGLSSSTVVASDVGDLLLTTGKVGLGEWTLSPLTAEDVVREFEGGARFINGRGFASTSPTTTVTYSIDTEGHLAHATVRYRPASAIVTQTLEPGAVTVSGALGTVTVVRGARLVTPTALSTTLNAPAVTALRGSRTLTPNSIASVTSLDSVTVVRGARTVAPSVLGTSTSVQAPALIRGSRTLNVSILAAAITPSTVGVVRGARVLTPNSLTAAVASGSLTIHQAMRPSPVVLGLGLQTPELSSARQITPAPLSLAATVFNASVVRGMRSLAPAPLALTLSSLSTSFTGQRTLTPSPVGMSTTARSVSVVRGAVALTPATLVRPLLVASPAVTTGGTVIQPLPVTFTSGLYSLSIVRGVRTVSPDVVAASTTLLGPRVARVLRPSAVAMTLTGHAARVAQVVHPASMLLNASMATITLGRAASVVTPLPLALSLQLELPRTARFLLVQPVTMQISAVVHEVARGAVTLGPAVLGIAATAVTAGVVRGAVTVAPTTVTVGVALNVPRAFRTDIVRPDALVLTSAVLVPTMPTYFFLTPEPLVGLLTFKTPMVNGYLFRVPSRNLSNLPGLMQRVVDEPDGVRRVVLPPAATRVIVSPWQEL